jgi:hypothetical protein
VFRRLSDVNNAAEIIVTISLLDQMLFGLNCGHTVVVGRLIDQKNWVCEECQKNSNLSVEPTKSRLAKDIDTAQQIDLQVKAKGGEVTRL